jgi:protein-S-isoprenylcysteine O-methyltransferase Ste14
MLVAVCGFAALDPELIAERANPGPGFDLGDALLSSVAGLALIFLPLPVAGVDVGRAQVPHFSTAVRGAALGVFVLGSLFAIWAAYANRFFSDFVRIQHERGHHVVTTGPYAHIRHPGYAGGIVAYVAVPVALGSTWALLPALVGAALLVARAAREDRFLHEKLDGYRAYAARVRCRLVPGVW